MSDVSNELATLSNNIDNQVSGALYQAYCLGRSKGRVDGIEEFADKMIVMMSGHRQDILQIAEKLKEHK